MSDMIANISREFYIHHLKNFMDGSKCCMTFSGSFRPNERLCFITYASLQGLSSIPFKINGVEVVKIFKNSCPHYTNEPTQIKLQNNSVKDLFFLFTHCDFIGSPNEMQCNPNFFSPGNSRPSIPPHRFSLGPLKQSMARQNNAGYERFQNHCRINHFKSLLLSTFQRSRVSIVNGPTSFEISMAVPMFIIEECAQQEVHCKIMCVETDQLLAIYNSQRLAVDLAEKVGNTIAFQVHLQSRISELSNLIYTTASFFLRVLMGQTTGDSFRHISHVIINDVHRHDAYSDILLSELKEALKLYPELRIILISSSAENHEFLQYFGEGEEINLLNAPTANNLNRQATEIMYLEDIMLLIDKERQVRPPSLAYATRPSILPDFATNTEILDQYLQDYGQEGSDETLNKFLYMVYAEFASINHRHSIYGTTILILAAKLGKTEHIRKLLELHADPFVADNSNMNAISAAIVGRNPECVALLNVCHGSGHAIKLNNPAYIDFNLITDLIRLILNRCDPCYGMYFTFL